VVASWPDVARDRTLGTDAADCCALLESVEEADASDVLAFVEAAIDALPDLSRWEPMFDPVLRVPGVVAAWRSAREPVRSFLGHGLLRVGHIDADELPDDLCERVAASYLDAEDVSFLEEELAAEGSLWPSGRFAGLLRRLALASDQPLAYGLARYAMTDAPPRDALTLAARAETEGSNVEEPVESWGLMRDLPESSIDALAELGSDLARRASGQLTSLARFRVLRALLEHGRASREHDALLSPECLDWVGDLGPACGLCGGREATSPHEPSPALVHLLMKLPVERSLAFLDAGSSADRAQVSTLVRAWLSEGRERFTEAARPRADALEVLPDALRAAISFAGARLMVAADGHLPRLQQREVLDALCADEASDETVTEHATRADRSRAIRNMSARVRRLLELRAPLPVLLRDASRLRMLERLERLDHPLERRVDEDGAGEDAGYGRPGPRWIALSSFVLHDLARGDPRLAPSITQLERLVAGDGDVGPNAAMGLEAADDAAPDDRGAWLGHYAFCALDIALGDDERTDQDDLYDIAERVVTGRPDAPPTHAGRERAADVKRDFWMRWLLVHVPRAAADLAPTSRSAL
jgi:hypothetical protein